MTTSVSSVGEDCIVKWDSDAKEKYDKVTHEKPKATETGGESRGPPFYFPYSTAVYILRLENKKYYVGISRNLEQRMVAHFTGNGAEWTKLHHPIGIISTYNTSKLDEWERKDTIHMMKKHGVENVRGACWAAPNLNKCPMLPESLRDTDDNKADTLERIAADIS